MAADGVDERVTAGGEKHKCLCHSVEYSKVDDLSGRGHFPVEHVAFHLDGIGVAHNVVWRPAHDEHQRHNEHHHRHLQYIAILCIILRTDFVIHRHLQ